MSVSGRLSLAPALWIMTGCGGPTPPAEHHTDIPTPTGPNVVLISIDSLRAAHLGTYGYARPTSPNIDRLAAEGVVFENHISSTSWTLPAHAAIFSSLPDSVHGCTDTDRILAEEVTTLAERFAAAGYHTAGFFAGPYLHPAFGLGQGFEDYENCTSYARALDEAPPESWVMDMDIMHRSHRDITNPNVYAAFTRWLHRPRPGRFFVFVHLWDVHYDFIPPSPYDTMFDPDYDGPVTGENFLFDPAINAGMSPRDLEHLVALYDGEVAWTDEYVGRLVASLEAAGVLDETVIAITADHGTGFFEHGLKGHRNSLFDELIRVPLVIRYPARIAPGARVTAQTRAIDIGPTLLELAGLPAPDQVMGESLVGLAAGRELDFDNTAVSELFSVGQRVRTVRTLEWKFYDVMVSGNRYWTNLLADPAEQMLRPVTPGPGDKLEARYLDIAADLSRRRQAHHVDQAPSTIPPEIRRQLQSLGYVGE